AGNAPPVVRTPMKHLLVVRKACGELRLGVERFLSLRDRCGERLQTAAEVARAGQDRLGLRLLGGRRFRRSDGYGQKQGQRREAKNPRNVETNHSHGLLMVKRRILYLG